MSETSPDGIAPLVSPVNAIEFDGLQRERAGPERDSEADMFDWPGESLFEALAARRRRDVERMRPRTNEDSPESESPEQESGAEPRQEDETSRRSPGVGARASGYTTAPLAQPPEKVGKRYLRAGYQYFLKNEQHSLAFEDRGARMVTMHNRADIVESMIEMAAAKGWRGIRVKGHEEFRRETWLQASLKGMGVRGYEPRAVDLARLDEMRQQLMHNQMEAVPETVAPADAAPPSPGTRSARRQQTRVPDTVTATEVPAPQGADPMEPATGSTDPLSGVRPINRAGRHALAAERAVRDGARAGRLLEHGEAPYQHDPDNSASYYVIYRDWKGRDHIAWGVDLARAMGESDARPGDTISIESLGKRWVTAEVPVRDAAGQVSGIEEKEAYRNSWRVDVIAPARSRAPDAREAELRPTARDSEADVQVPDLAPAPAPAPAPTELPPVQKALHLAVIAEAMRQQGFSEKSVEKVKTRADRMLDTLQAQGVEVPAPKVYDPKAPSTRGRKTSRSSQPTRTKDVERTMAPPNPSMPSL